MFSLTDFARIINAIADPVFVKNRQHRCILLNDAYCRFMGVAREDVIGRSDYDVFPKSEADVFWEKDELVLRTGEENVNEEEFTDASGVTHFITTKKSLYVSVSGEQFIVGCIRDLTELRRGQQELQHSRDHLEELVRERTAELAATNDTLLKQIAENERTNEKLRQSQKMEAIGRLAGGIAHDFNNLLNVIIGYSALTEAETVPDSRMHENAAQIRKAAERAASLTQQLLAFSRKQVLNPEVLDLNGVIASMSSMLRSFIPEDVELDIIPCAASPSVRADRGQIEQVIMNLVANGKDAMPHGGKLVVKTINTCFTDDEGQLQPRPCVTLQVSDNGHGMDAATQAHMFEPFFTTKPVGKGTGLGLASVYGIVQQSGGHIQVSSKPGHGTTVIIHLPQVVTECIVPPSPELQERPASGSETILLVEDQEDLRTLLQKVLESNGYHALAAANGTEALKMAEAPDLHIDLLVTDIVMPGMRGWQLTERLLASRPELKVLYISGYSDRDLMSKGGPQAGIALLEKPFRPEVFLRKVRHALDSPQRIPRSSANTHTRRNPRHLPNGSRRVS